MNDLQRSSVYIFFLECLFFFFFAPRVSCLFTHTRYLLLSPVTHCIPSITIGKLKAIGFGCIIWEATALPASCFLYSWAEQGQLTALSLFPEHSAWRVIFFLLCSHFCAIRLGVAPVNGRPLSFCDFSGVRRDWWQVGSVQPRLLFNPSMGKLLISRSPFPFLQQDKRTEFIYYSRLGHWIVMNCATHWTRKIFICKDIIACLFLPLLTLPLAIVGLST